MDELWNEQDFCRLSLGLKKIKSHLDPALKRWAIFKALLWLLFARERVTVFKPFTRVPKAFGIDPKANRS